MRDYNAICQNVNKKMHSPGNFFDASETIFQLLRVPQKIPYKLPQIDDLFYRHVAGNLVGTGALLFYFIDCKRIVRD
jgi:hypothetical protein